MLLTSDNIKNLILFIKKQLKQKEFIDTNA